jgi:hypothetical protein
MGFDKNGKHCPHNLVAFDKDTNEYYCEDCGDVVDPPAQDDDDFELPPYTGIYR